MSNQADTEKQKEALRKQFINEAAAITEKLMEFDRLLIIERNLTKEHRAFAAALYCVNLRETYPGENGKPDPVDFDKIAAAAAKYYDDNTK